MLHTVAPEFLRVIDGVIIVWADVRRCRRCESAITAEVFDCYISKRTCAAAARGSAGAARTGRCTRGPARAAYNACAGRRPASTGI